MRIYILFFLISNICFCQQKAGFVNYKKQTKFKKSKDKAIININEMINKGDNLVMYKLNFKESISKFEKIQKIETDKKALLMSRLSAAGYEGVVYRDDSKDLLIRSIMKGGEQFIINYPNTYLKWELINEKKVIGKFDCFKAITRKGNRSLKNKVEPISVVAWYCPQIPVRTGPYIYGGLPGLILELETTSDIFYATKISLRENDIVLKRPEKGTKISIEEYSKIIMGIANDIKN